MPELRKDTQLFMNGVKNPEFLVYLAGDEADPACRGKPVEVFFPTRGGSTREAKDICAGCRELRPCAAWARKQNAYLHGVWGGTSWGDRAGRQ